MDDDDDGCTKQCEGFQTLDDINVKVCENGYSTEFYMHYDGDTTGTLYYGFSDYTSKRFCNDNLHLEIPSGPTVAPAKTNLKEEENTPAPVPTLVIITDPGGGGGGGRPPSPGNIAT